MADAAKALDMAEPTAPRLYNAARIHAQAAIAAATEARKTGQDAVSLVARYQDQAMALLGKWHKRLSARRPLFLASRPAPGPGTGHPPAKVAFPLGWVTPLILNRNSRRPGKLHPPQRHDNPDHPR